MTTSTQTVKIPGLLLLRFFFTIAYIVQKTMNHKEGVSNLPLIRLLQKDSDKGGFSMNDAEVGTFMKDTSLGWMVKALYGPIVDNMPLFGYRRKGWLMLTSGLAAVAWFAMALSGTSAINLLYLELMFINVLAAMGDVVVDALMIDLAKKLERDHDVPEGTANRPLQAAQWLGAGIAMTAGALTGGVIAQFFDLRWAAVISGVIPLLFIFLIAFAVEEEKVEWDWTKAMTGFKAVGLLFLVGGFYYWAAQVGAVEAFTFSRELLTLVTVVAGVALAWDALTFMRRWNGYPWTILFEDLGDLPLWFTRTATVLLVLVPPLWLVADGAAPLVMPLVQTGFLVGAMLMLIRVPWFLVPVAVFLPLWFSLPFNADASYFVNLLSEHLTLFAAALKEPTGFTGAIHEFVVFLKLATPTEVAALIAPNGDGFGELFFGSVFKPLIAVGMIVGAIIWGTRFKSAPLVPVLYACVAAQLALVVAYMLFVLVFPSPGYLLVLGLVTGAIGVVVILSVLSYAVAMIPDRDEASLYAFLMSLINIGAIYGAEVLGGTLYANNSDQSPIKDEAGKVIDIQVANPEAGFMAVAQTSLVWLVALAGVVWFMNHKGWFNVQREE